MQNAAIALNLLFLPAIIAANILLFWVYRETKKAGVWPTEKFFGFERRRPFQLFAVIRLLRQRIQDTDDVAETRKYRRWLRAIYWGYGLFFFAMAVLLTFTAWLYPQLP